MKFREQEKKRFDALKPVLQHDFSTWKKYLNPDLIKALPHLGIGSSVFKRLKNVFKDEDLTLAFTFQSKYLGMSAWKCPSMFSIIPHLEHEFGVHHVKGGLYKINEKMSEIAQKNGARIITERPVRNILVKKGKARGLILDDGYQIEFDHLILNADFAFSINNLISNAFLKKYKREKVKELDYSCSTFMLYLGLSKKIDIPFHSIVFAKDYKRNIEDVFETGKLSNDISFYIRNGSILDASMAPEGHSALYVLVPVPNLKLYQNWSTNIVKNFRKNILSRIEQRLEHKKFRKLY